MLQVMGHSVGKSCYRRKIPRDFEQFPVRFPHPLSMLVNLPLTVSLLSMTCDLGWRSPSGFFMSPHTGTARHTTAPATRLCTACMHVHSGLRVIFVGGSCGWMVKSSRRKATEISVILDYVFFSRGDSLASSVFTFLLSLQLSRAA